MLRKLLTGASVLIAFVLLSQNPAFALPYDGTDPSPTGCAASAITVATAPVIEPVAGATVGTVELRWSTTCQTNWARVTRTDGFTSYQMQTAVFRWADGYVQSESLAGYSSIYSNQLYGNGYYVCADARVQRPGGQVAIGSGACA